MVKFKILIILLSIDVIGKISFHPISPNTTCHTAYCLEYSEAHEQAKWVSYTILSSNLSGTVTRTDNFRPDPVITTGSAELSDYRRSGYDRGHLAPSVT